MELYQKVLFSFAECLVAGKYKDALAYLSSSEASIYDERKIKISYLEMYEGVYSKDLVLQLANSFQEWPAKQIGDVGWVYVAIYDEGGDVSEAVSGIVVEEDGELKLREIEWGRP